MKTIIASFVAALVLSVSSFGQVVTPEQKKAGEEVMATIAKWADAVRDRDTKALDKIFEADLVITTFDGKTRGKAEELEILKPGGDLKTVSVTNEDVRLRIFDKTAIATAVTRMKFLIGEKESQAVFRYTAVFVKSDGRWQIVALQTARVAQ
jgi:uncharacterized protein (TIGR02246 family)